MKRTATALLLLLATTAADADIYTWKDARGTEHYTNSIHEIPARYLRKARVLDVATGKKGGLVTEQPAPGAAAAAPGQAPLQPQPQLGVVAPGPQAPVAAQAQPPAAAAVRQEVTPPRQAVTNPRPSREAPATRRERRRRDLSRNNED